MSEELRQRILEIVLDHIAHDKYPSGQMMNLLEAALREDDEIRSRFADALAEKIEADRYPSLHMIRRSLRLVS